MFTGKVPVKTEQGYDEIAHRTRRMSQRHRTVLLLVDGHRTEDEILSLAARAGVPPLCYAELVAQGLVAAPVGAQAQAGAPRMTGSSMPAGQSAFPADVRSPAPAGPEVAVEDGVPGVDAAWPDEPATQPLPLRSAFVRSGMAPPSDSGPGPLDAGAAPAPAAPAPAGRQADVDENRVPAAAKGVPTLDAWAGARADSLPPAALYASRFSASGFPAMDFASSQSEPDSLLPPMRTLAPDSTVSSLGDSLSLAAEDRPLEEARDLLMRAVSREAPVAGSLTLIRLRRASSRDEMRDLLDEVEARIIRPRNREAAEKVLRHARHLLGLSRGTSFLMSR
jgi:hypothetical protein